MTLSRPRWRQNLFRNMKNKMMRASISINTKNNIKDLVVDLWKNC